MLISLDYFKSHYCSAYEDTDEYDDELTKAVKVAERQLAALTHGGLYNKGANTDLVKNAVGMQARIVLEYDNPIADFGDDCTYTSLGIMGILKAAGAYRKEEV